MANRHIPLQVRLEENTIPEPMSGCHLWVGACNKQGYGSIRVGGKTRRVHRVVWSLGHGPVPAGMMVLHGCDNPACVNERHLHLGSSYVNMREMVARGRSPNAVKTHCPRGHEYTDQNTKYRRERNGRDCLACGREYARRARHIARRYFARREGEKGETNA